MYSRRMDSQYAHTVLAPEVAVQFRPSAADGRAGGLRVALRAMPEAVLRLPAWHSLLERPERSGRFKATQINEVVECRCAHHPPSAHAALEFSCS